MVWWYDHTMPYHHTTTLETLMERTWYGGMVVCSPKGERKELLKTTSPLTLFLGELEKKEEVTISVRII